MKIFKKRLKREGFFYEKEIWRDERESINGLWIEDIAISDNAYWILVGRRHGVLQLYTWDGKRENIGGKPFSNTVTRILYGNSRFVVCMPPYIVIYTVEDPLNPQGWKVTKVDMEGSRPAGAIALYDDAIVFNTVTRFIKAFSISGSGEEDFLFSFPYSYEEVGEVFALDRAGEYIFLSGGKGIVLYTRGGMRVNRIEKIVKRAFSFKGGKVYMHDGRYIYVGDEALMNVETVGEVDLSSSNLEVSPCGNYVLMSSEDENRLVVYDLSEGRVIEDIREAGYHTVRISPDGSVFTCSREKEGDGYVYNLVRLGGIFTAREDYTYEHPKNLRAESLKEIEEIERDIKNKLINTVSREGRKRLKGILEEVNSRRVELFVKEKEEILKEGKVTERDIRETEGFLREFPENEKLKDLYKRLVDYVKESLRKELERIEEIIEDKEISSFLDLKGNPEISSLFRRAEDLPEDYKREFFISAERLLKRKFAEKIIERYRIKVFEDKVCFGFQYLERRKGNEVRVRWYVRTEGAVKEGKPLRILYFEREDGFILEPRRYNNVLEGEEMPRWVSRYLRHLNRLMVGDRSYIFKGFEPSPWFVRNLEAIVKGIKDQRDMGEGILILEGDAGTGKNFMVEVVARLTGRPLFIIPCHSQMEKDELTYIYEYNPRTGTRKRYSELIRALRTEGAIIYFDEINTMPYSLIKMLNPLFDYRRSLIMPGGEVVVGRDVILMGSMNPQHYMGVRELPQDVKSRAEIITVEYPPFSENNLFFHPDEAMILKKHVPSLSHLDTEEFYFKWHKYINDIETEVSVSEEEKVALEGMKAILKVADRIRYQYRLYQSNQSEEPVNYVFSIRDSIRCVRKWVREGDVERAIKGTVLPKISNLYEKEIVENIIAEELQN